MQARRLLEESPDLAASGPAYTRTLLGKSKSGLQRPRRKQQLELVEGIWSWFQTGKGVRQGCILSPCLFNLYAEDIMRNAELEEAQAGIKISGKNINNLRYADDTTLMAESEEELKNLLMKVKEESEKLA